MFKSGDLVVMNSENIKAIVLGYANNFKNLVYIVPEDLSDIGNYSAFEDELTLLEERAIENVKGWRQSIDKG